MSAVNNIIVIEPTTSEHLDELALNMRESDLQEITCISNRGVRATLALSAELSSWVSTCLVDGAVAAVWGVAPRWAENPRDDFAVPWMLGTPLTNAHPKTLVSESKRQLRLMLNDYDHLQQWVDIRNTASVRWLKHLGFTFGEAKPYGMAGELFYPFWYKNNV